MFKYCQISTSTNMIESLLIILFGSILSSFGAVAVYATYEEFKRKQTELFSPMMSAVLITAIGATFLLAGLSYIKDDISELKVRIEVKKTQGTASF